MKQIIRYACEMCNDEYETEAGALNCESRGRPAPLVVGLLFSDPFYTDIVFAVAAWRDRGHAYDVTCWAARDTGSGDNLPPRPGSRDGDERCGFLVALAGERLGRPPDRSLPAYQRLVEALRAAGIEPTDQTKEEPPGTKKED